MDLAYVDKLARGDNCINYLLVRQDLFDGTIDAKGMTTKASQETIRAFSTLITKKNRPKKTWVDKETEFAGAFEKLCEAEGIQNNSTMSETKAEFFNVQYDPWKNTLLLLGRQWILLHSQIDSVLHNSKI